MCVFLLPHILVFITSLYATLHHKLSQLSPTDTTLNTKQTFLPPSPTTCQNAVQLFPYEWRKGKLCMTAKSTVRLGRFLQRVTSNFPGTTSMSTRTGSTWFSKLVFRVGLGLACLELTLGGVEWSSIVESGSGLSEMRLDVWVGTEWPGLNMLRMNLIMMQPASQPVTLRMGTTASVYLPLGHPPFTPHIGINNTLT